jgi:hypothetical protein
MIGDLTDTSSKQLFSLHIENIAIKCTRMIIHIGNQLDCDVNVTMAHFNNEPRDLFFVTGSGAKTPNPLQDQPS